MNGIHDMGGMHGFGPVDPADGEPFHADWEPMMQAIRTVLGAESVFNVDQLRFACERLDPAVYLAADYYEIRLYAIERLLIERGILEPGELDDRLRRADSEPAERRDPELTARVMKSLRTPASYEIEAPIEPRFAVGDQVRVRNAHPEGHTRSPRYVRRATGDIVDYHGVQRFPDASADGDTSVGDPLYSVEFPARELWGDDHPESDSIVIQLWERYLTKP